MGRVLNVSNVVGDLAKQVMLLFMQQSDLMGLWTYLPCSKIPTREGAVNFLPIRGLYDCEYELASKEWIKSNSVQFFIVQNSFVRTEKPSCNTFI